MFTQKPLGRHSWVWLVPHRAVGCIAERPQLLCLTLSWSSGSHVPPEMSPVTPSRIFLVKSAAPEAFLLWPKGFAHKGQKG